MSVQVPVANDLCKHIKNLAVATVSRNCGKLATVHVGCSYIMQLYCDML